MLFGLAEYADACIIFLQGVHKVVLGLLVCVVLCQHHCTRPGVFQVDSGDGKSHNGTEMQFKLAEIGGVTERDHTRIVRPWRQFGEYYFALFGQEKLHTPQSCARKCGSHLARHVLRLLQLVGRNGKRLPALAVVAALLHVSDGWTE